MDRVLKLLHDLGVYSHYKGYRYLAKALDLLVKDDSLSLNSILLVVSQEYHISSQKVRRNIRTILESCWHKGNRAKLVEIAGMPLEVCPTLSEFLDILATYLIREKDILSL